MNNQICACVAAAGLAAGFSTFAGEIEIVNPSFESQMFADGNYNENDVTGWIGSGPWYHVSNPQDDRFDGTTEGSPLPNPIDGVNIVGLNAGSTLYQDLGAVVEARTTYKLTLLVGHRRGVPFGTPTVSLLANGLKIAEGMPDAPEDGKFAALELVYEAPELGETIGKALRIQVKSEGVDAQSWFDDFRLEAVPPAELNGNIAITNSSFEDPVLADGDYTINAMPGWSGTGIQWHVANPANNWFFGTSLSEAGPNPIDGANVAGINTGTAIYQDLAAMLRPGVHYMLEMRVGQRIGVPFGEATVSLIAGGQVLAEATPATPASGSFERFQMAYESPRSGGIIGQPLRIQISCSGPDAQIWIDNIVLTADVLPPPPPGPEIPIANQSFEQPLLADGDNTIDDAPGWVGVGPRYHVANPRDDWFFGTTEGSAPINPIDGMNIGGINVGTTLYQDLTTAVQPGVAYTLRMLVGHRIGVPFGSLDVALLAAGQVLAQGTPPSPIDGHFSPFELVYYSPSNGPAIGQLMRIQLSVSGANAQAWFDDIRLNVGNPPPPTIIAQPASQTVVTGQTASISVDVIGIPVLQYQWYFGDLLLQNETNRVLDLPAVSMSEAGNYSVIISNVGGSVTSEVATLTVELPPPCTPAPSGVIAWWPFEGTGADAAGENTATFSVDPVFGGGKVGQSLTLGGAAGFASVAGDSGLDLGKAEGFTIESWIRPDSVLGAQALAEWNNLSGGFGVGIFVGLPVPAGGGAGALSANIVDTENHSHVVASPGNIISSGVWQHIAVTFTKSNGQARIYLNGSQVADETFGSFTPETSPGYQLLLGHRQAGGIQYPFTGRMDELTFYARALEPEELAGIFGAGASGKCAGGFAPVIVSNPKAVTAVRGDTVEFSVGAGGSAPLTYQWRFEGVDLDGATNRVYHMDDVRLDQAGRYSVAVSNEFGIAESAEAILDVNRRVTVIRVVESSGTATTEVTVPVEIVANGAENAAGFSVNFDPQKLVFHHATLGSGVPDGAALLVNTNELSQGRIGLAVGLPSGMVLSEDTLRLLELSFVVGNVLNQTGTQITFGDIPTQRQVVDAEAGLLPVTFAGGVVLIRNSQFEGDVAPRPGGDRTLTTIDWVQMGRYVARLDAIDSTNEFQRADCAPRATKGNGLISASDWVQAGRYAIGLDPLTVIGGPVEPAGDEGQALSAVGDSGRRLTLTNTSILPGETNGVSVVLDAVGNENAVSFSVVFDAAKLRYVGPGIGSGSTGLIFNLNTNDVSNGHLGVAVAASPGMSMGAGPRQLFLIRFVPLVAPMETVPVAFSNNPVPKDVSDISANSLPTDYVGGIVNISEPAGPPLNIVRSGNSVLVTWTTNSLGFVLEATEGDLGSAWQPVAGVLTVGDQRLAVVNAEGKDRFFRLKKQ